MDGREVQVVASGGEDPPDLVLAVLHWRIVRAARHVVLGVAASRGDAPALTRLGDDVEVGLVLGNTAPRC